MSKLNLKRIAKAVRVRTRRAVATQLLNWNVAPIPVEETFIIAGSNRSGTTWLQEVIASLPNTVTSFEPLHVDAVSKAASAGFHKLKYCDHDAEWSSGREYLQRVLTGQEWNSYTAALNPIRDCFQPQNLVVKFIHANGIIEWMTNQFPTRKPVVVIRHPCAVLSSVLHLKWDNSYLRDTLMQSELVQSSTPLMSYVETLTTPLEQLAARWCLENAPLFRMANPDCIHRITYESLVSRGPTALMELFQAWNIDPPQALAETFAKESTLSAQNRNYDNAQHRLSKWKSERTIQETTTILRVLNDFGLDFYSDEIRPNEERLRDCTASGLLDELGSARAA